MLRTVQVKNFKSFVDSTFDLSPLTLVLGSNAAGKSNFFDALRFLRYMGADVSIRDAIEGHTGATPTEEPILGIRGGKQELPHFGSGSSVVEVRVVIGTKGGDIHYEIAVDVERYRVVKEELTADFHPGPYVFSTHPEVDAPTHDPDAPGLSARFYKNQRGTRPKREFNPAESILSQFEGRRAESTLNEEVARTTREELAGITPLELRPEVLRGYSRLGTFQLGEHGENFAAVVWDLTNFPEEQGNQEALEVVYSWLNELTPQRIAEVGAQDAPTGDVIFALREEAYDRWISARSLSDGTLRYVALTFALFGGRARRTFAIEELENGINPTRMGLLLRMLEASTASESGVQVLASTHAPQLLERASDDTVRRAVMIGWDADRLCSRVCRLQDLPSLEPALAGSTIAELQAEGWLQFAADA